MQRGNCKTFDGQGKDHDLSYDVVAASMTERIDGKTPRQLLASACVRSLIQFRLVGLQLHEFEGAVILKTLAQRLQGRAWIEKEVKRLLKGESPRGGDVAATGVEKHRRKNDKRKK